MIPLAEATAIFFVAPLLITAFSAVFLKEPVGIRRWSALSIGFVGVIVIVRPGGLNFEWAFLLPLLAAVAYAALHTLTRNMGLSERASTMALYIQVTFIVVCTGMGVAFGDGRYAGSGHPAIEFLLRAWHWPDPIRLADHCRHGTVQRVGRILDFTGLPYDPGRTRRAIRIHDSRSRRPLGLRHLERAAGRPFRDRNNPDPRVREYSLPSGRCPSASAQSTRWFFETSLILVRRIMILAPEKSSWPSVRRSRKKVSSALSPGRWLKPGSIQTQGRTTSRRRFVAAARGRRGVGDRGTSQVSVPPPHRRVR